MEIDGWDEGWDEGWLDGVSVVARFPSSIRANAANDGTTKLSFPGKLRY